MSLHQWWVPLQAGHYSLEAWRGNTCHMISSVLVGNVGSDFVPWVCNCSSALWHQAILSLGLLLWGLHLEPQEMGGICQCVMTGLERCNTSFHPGNQFGECSLLVDSSFWVWKVLDPSGGLTMGAASSSVTFTTTSSTGELVYAGWALSGMVFPDWVVRDSSGRAMLPKMASSGKEM